MLLKSKRVLNDGSEHTVISDPATNKVIKVTHEDVIGDGVVGQSANVNEYFKSLEYQNILFNGDSPEKNIKFDGIVYLDGDLPQIVTTQPYKTLKLWQASTF